MKIDIVKVGNLECNCYIIEKDNEVIVIDPGDDGNKIIDRIGSRKVVGIIITHYHFDHIGALEELVNKYSVLVNDRYNMDEGINRIGNFIFKVIYTPGHKEDSIVIYFEDNKWMFCGDFIFRDGIGRCDLPGGDMKEMIKSIEKIKKYDNDIVLYPGHGDKSMLGYEKKYNIYFK